VRFALFGGVRIVRDGIDIEITQPKQRGILGLLLASAAEPVSLTELIDTLWPGEPAASVTNQIHRHVGALRRVCEPHLQRREVGRYIHPTGTGYRLLVDAETADVARFRVLVEQGRRATGSGARGAALRDYLDALAVAAAPAGDDRLGALPVFVGLEDERVRALIATVDQCEAPDEYAALLPALRGACARHRLDEALHAQLITALAAAGRAGEGLAVYSGIRHALADELGSIPSQVLVQAQARALRAGQHPAAVGAVATRRVVTPAQLPSLLSGFAGRQDQLAALHSGDAAGRRHTLLITGMAGVGKTTLAQRYAAEIAPDYPDGQLYANLRGFDATAAPTNPHDAVRDMLEGLGVPAQIQPNSLDACTGMLRSILAERRVLIVLDNAHDYHQVEPLLPGAGASRAIITSRNQIPGLTAFHQATALHLEPFDDEEVVDFFRQRLPPDRADHYAITRLGKTCGGLPLALAIVAARAAANPGFPLDLLVREFAQEQTPLTALNAGSADLDLDTVFSWSDRGLSDDASRTFAVLSAHSGPEISTAAAISMSGLDGRRARDVLTELTVASVLRESRPDRFVFHDLVREYAATQLGDNRQAAAARLVNHYVRSVRSAFLRFGRPGIAPVDETVVGIVPETFESSRQAIFWYVDQRRTLHEVCRLAADLGDYRSALLLMLDWRPMSQTVDSHYAMLPFAELSIEATRHVDDPALVAEIFRDVAASLAHTGHPDRARSFYDRALAIFIERDDKVGVANVYRNIGSTLPVDTDERVHLMNESVAIARQLNNPAILATSLSAYSSSLFWAERFEDSFKAAAEGAAVAGTHPELEYLEPIMESIQVQTLAGAGRMQESADLAERVLDRVRRDGDVRSERSVLLTLGDVLTELGRTAEAADTWRRLLALISGPESAKDLHDFYDDTDGAVIIARIEAKLDALTHGKATTRHHRKTT
jgi:DNA-binding SARP family transcriptional activator